MHAFPKTLLSQFAKIKGYHASSGTTWEYFSTTTCFGGINYHLLHLCTILESFDLINDLGIPAI